MRKERLIAFLPAAVATIALILSFFSSFWCENVKFEPSGGESDDNPALSFGVFYLLGTKETERPGGITLKGEACVSYNNEIQTDGNWIATMVFACIAFVIGGIGVFWTWLATLLYLNQKKWKALGISYIFCCLFQGLTFLFLNSAVCKENSLVSSAGSQYPEECSWDMGTRTNIAAVVFWFIAGTLMLTLPNSDRPAAAPAETQTVTYQEKKNADGTTDVEETNVVTGTYVRGKDIEG